MSESGIGRPIDILLIEDNEGDARLAQEALRDAKVVNEIAWVQDGVQALRYVRGEPPYSAAARPDVILLDLNLPRKDGLEVLDELKQDEALRRIPVVILTVSDAEGDVARSYDLHANCYIKKPLDLDRFLEVVRAIESFWLTVVRLPQDGKAH